MKNQYTEIKGDLITLAKKGKFDMIVHGCNCYNLMGAGIAWQIKQHFPDAYKVDKNDRRLPIEKLGDMSVSSPVINLYTQFMPGANLDYEALTLGLRKVNIMFSGLHIGLPMIGAGIAGGDWERIRRIIQQELTSCEVTVVIYDKN